jgi:AraC-like DNA-binding protein
MLPGRIRRASAKARQLWRFPIIAASPCSPWRRLSGMDDALRVLSLGVREPDPQRLVARHSHQTPQLYACVQGRVTIRIEGQACALRHGEAVLVPPRLGRIVERHGPVSYLVAIFDCPRLDLTPLARQVLPLAEELRPDFTALVAELRGVGRPDSNLLCQTLLLRLLLGLRRQAQAARDPGLPLPRPELSRLVRQVEQVMRQNLHRPLSREALARAVNLSAPHLARLFRTATGSTLHRRLVELRIDLAKHLLDASTLSAAQIAGEIGLASASHFTKFFAAATGQRPGDWRRRGR